MNILIKSISTKINRLLPVLSGNYRRVYILQCTFAKSHKKTNIKGKREKRKYNESDSYMTRPYIIYLSCCQLGYWPPRGILQN